jgi:hypothetical protein
VAWAGVPCFGAADMLALGLADDELGAGVMLIFVLGVSSSVADGLDVDVGEGFDESELGVLFSSVLGDEEEAAAAGGPPSFARRRARISSIFCLSGASPPVHDGCLLGSIREIASGIWNECNRGEGKWLWEDRKCVEGGAEWQRRVARLNNGWRSLCLYPRVPGYLGAA